MRERAKERREEYRQYDSKESVEEEGKSKQQKQPRWNDIRNKDGKHDNRYF